MKDSTDKSSDPIKTKKFKQTFFDLNIELLISNPLKKKVYMAMLLIDTAIVFIIPLMFICARGSITRIQNSMNSDQNPHTFVPLLILAIALTLLIFIGYWALFIIENYKVVKTSKQNLKMMTICHKVLITAFVAQQIPLKLPISLLLQQEIRNHMSGGHEIQKVYLAVALIGFLVDKYLFIVFHNFLTIHMPVDKLPWSSQKSAYQNLLLLQKPLLVVCFITPLDWKYSVVMYSVLLVVTLLIIVSNIKKQDSYNWICNYLLHCQQATMLATSIFQMINHNGSYNGMLTSFIMLVICALLAINQVKEFFYHRSICQIEPSSLDSLSQFIEALVVVGNAKHKDKLQVLQETFTVLLVLGRNHQQTCHIDSCVCKKSKYQKYFYDKVISMKSDDHKEQQMIKKYLIHRIHKQVLALGYAAMSYQLDLQNQKKVNSNTLEHLQMLLIMYRLQHKHQSLICYFQITELHNCKSCTLSNCYLQYYLKRVISSKHSKQNNSHEQFTKFDSYISYENHFRQFCQYIEDLNGTVKEYWKSLLKEEKATKTKDQYGNQILVDYKAFYFKFKQINKECGSFINVMLLSWRLYRDTLNFEMECGDTFELLQNLLSRKKMDHMMSKRIDAEGFMDDHIDSQLMIILVSGNKRNLSQIMNINKQFIMFSQYEEDDLLGGRLSLLLPKILDQVHDKFLSRFVQDKKQDFQQLTKNHLLLKLKSGTLVPMDLKIQVNITEEGGIVLLGILRPSLMFFLDDKEHIIGDVYFILTDPSDKILHISQNCVENLNFNTQIVNKDVMIADIFPILKNLDQEDETLMMNEGIVIELNFHLLNLYDNNNMNPGISSRKYISVKMFLRINDYGNGNILKEYYFIIENDLQSTEPKNLYMTQTQYQETSSNSVEESQPQPSDDFQLMSISSASSSSSSQSLSYQKINEIKSRLEFTKLPQGLQRFRKIIVLVFILIVCTAVTLLVVNMHSKSAYTLDISALKNQKLMRNYMSLSRLSVLMLYGFAQIPDQTWGNMTIEIGLNTKEQVHKFLQSNLTSSINELHSLMSEFSKEQAKWDDQFVNLVTQQKINMTMMSTSGNMFIDDMPYFNGLQEYMFRAYDFINVTSADIKLQNIDAFAIIGKLSSLPKYLPTIPYNNRVFFTDLLICIYNSLLPLQDQMNTIDDSFIDEIKSKGSGTMKLLMIFTVACCALLLLFTSFLIPFILDVGFIQVQVKQFLSKIKAPVIENQIQKITDFEEYVVKNRFLADYYQEKQKTYSRFQSTLKLTNRTSMGKVKSQQELYNQQSFYESQLQYPESRVKEMLESDSSDESPNNKQKKKRPKRKHSSKRNSYNEMKGVPLSTRLYKSLLVLLITVPLQAFYGVCYYLSYTILSNLQTSYEAYQVFYDRVPCVADNLYFIQTSIMFNLSLTEGSYYGKRFQHIQDECYQNENAYKDVKYKMNSMFTGLQSELDQQDGTNFCNYTKSIGLNTDDCETIHGGYLLIPSDNMIQMVLTHANNQRNTLSQTKGATSTQLSTMFYNQLTVDYTFLHLKYVLNVFKHIETVAHNHLISSIDKSFRIIVTVFAVYMAMLFIISTLIQKKIILRFKHILLTIKLLLKLIPSDEIITMKRYLVRVNLKQL